MKKRGKEMEMRVILGSDIRTTTILDSREFGEAEDREAFTSPEEVMAEVFLRNRIPTFP